MADSETLARPYAKAVFELAQSEGNFAEWSARLSTMADVIASPEVAAVIDHPAVSRERLAQLLVGTLGKSVGPEASNLLRLLVDNGRLMTLPAIAQQFETLRAQAEARVDVEITTAAPVDVPQQRQLADAIGRRLQRQVHIDWKTDESLVAGAVIRAGDLVIDGSVRGELDRLRSALAH
jgi:F-type H+-transporting ATPase subunit delta